MGEDRPELAHLLGWTNQWKWRLMDRFRTVCVLGLGLDLDVVVVPGEGKAEDL